MKAEEQVITIGDYEEYKEHKSNKRIEMIWNNILNQLSPEGKSEALEKGFVIKENGKSMGMLNLSFEIPRASKEVEIELASHYALMICLID